jgi:hypothetical protein
VRNPTENLAKRQVTVPRDKSPGGGVRVLRIDLKAPAGDFKR